MKMKVFGFIYFVVFIFLCNFACSSSPKRIEGGFVTKTGTEAGVIGAKGDKFVIQRETHAQDELRMIQWKNNQFEDNLNHEYFMLKWCREDLADFRLGGHGDMVSLPEIDNMKQAAEVKEELGLNRNGDISFLSEEDFLKRIQIERNYEGTLQKMLKTVKAQKEDCERKMGQARMKNGLPSKRYQGNGHGELHENNLDDAFRIMKMQSASHPIQ